MDALSGEIVYWHWLAVGALLIAVEVVVPGVLFLWLGIAAGLTGLLVLVFPGSGWEVHLLVFAVLSVASVYLGRRAFGRSEGSTDHPTLNKRGRRHIGHTFTLESRTVDGRGRMRVGDSSWSVVVDGTGDLAAGTRVRVTGVDGATLRIASAEPATPERPDP